jgi:plasmid stabilization system protein ParE
MVFGVRVGPGAMADIEKISRWWRRHRMLAPLLFDQELDASLDMLEAQPYIGTPTRLRSLGDVRVIVLRRTRYLVAYQIRPDEGEVWIVRVRHASRRPLAKR